MSRKGKKTVDDANTKAKTADTEELSLTDLTSIKTLLQQQAEQLQDLTAENQKLNEEVKQKESGMEGMQKAIEAMQAQMRQLTKQQRKVNKNERQSTSSEEAEVNTSLKNLALFSNDEELGSDQSITDEEESTPRATVPQPTMTHFSSSPWQNTNRASAAYPSTRRTSVNNQVSRHQSNTQPYMRTPGTRLPHFKFGSDVELYLKRVQMYIENGGIPTENRCNILMSGLDDITLNIVLKEGRYSDIIVNFDRLREFMLKRFKPSETGQTAKFTFRTCRQKKDTAIEDYVTELYGLATLAYPQANNDILDQTILEQLLNGLYDTDMRIKIVEKSPATIEEAINHYKHFKNVKKYKESVEAMTPIEKNEVPVESKAKVGKVTFEHQAASRNDTRWRTTPSPVRYGRTSDGEPVCFNCHRVGHISRSCPKPRWKKNGFRDFANRQKPNYDGRHEPNWRWRDRDYYDRSFTRPYNSEGAARDVKRGTVTRYEESQLDGYSPNSESRYRRSPTPNHERRGREERKHYNTQEDQRQRRGSYENSHEREIKSSKGRNRREKEDERQYTDGESDQSRSRERSNKQVNIKKRKDIAKVTIPQLSMTLHVEGSVNGISGNFTIDCGSEVSIISQQFWANMGIELPIQKCDIAAYSVADDPLEVLGVVELQLSLFSTTRKGGSFDAKHTFFIIGSLTHDIILGMDFFVKYHAVLDVVNKKMKVSHEGVTTIHNLYTVEAGQFLSTARVTTDTRVPARTGIPIKLTVSACTGNMQHEMRSTTLFSPNEASFAKHQVLLPYAITTLKGEDTVMTVINPTSTDIVLHKGTQLGYLSVVDDDDCIQLPHTGGQKDNSRLQVIIAGAYKRNHVELPEFMQSIDIGENEVSDEDLNFLKTVLLKNIDAFAKDKHDFGRTDIVKHTIETGSAKPVRQSPRRLTPPQRNVVKEQIQQMLQDGVIRESTSPWSSPIVIVNKKDGSPRTCIDYRLLNKVTEKDSFPLPRIEDMFDTLSDAAWFHSLDLLSGYHQVCIAEEDKYKTAFTSHYGLFEYNVMPFGLCNAPSTFSRLMTAVLAGLQWDIALNYIDDVLVFGKTARQSIERLDVVLQRFKKAKLKIQPKKSHLLKRKIGFLGHILSEGQIAMDPDKIRAISETPIPLNLRELRAFLGASGYYRKHIRGYATIAAPLYSLTTKNAAFIWNDSAQKAFDALRQEIANNVVLKMPNFTTEFNITTDASDVGIGAVLSQVNSNGHDMPISFASRVLSKTEKKWSVTERELLAIIWALSQFREYVYGRHFKLYTDHLPLTWLKTCKTPTPRMHRWILQLAEYDFDVVYKPGKANVVADGLSRLPIKGASVSSVRLIQFEGPVSEHDIKLAQREDETLQDFEEIRLLKLSPAEVKQLPSALGTLYKIRNTCAKVNDIWYRLTQDKNAVIILPPSLHNVVVSHLHDVPTAAHFGIDKTVQKVTQRYFWPKLSKIVTRYLALCSDCARKKTPKKPLRAPLYPIIPERPFELIEVDITGPFPKTEQGNTVILVILDCFTRWPEAYPLPNQESARVAACLEDYFCRYGPPKAMLTDQGRNFESSTIEELCNIFSIQKKRTTAYKPSTNGAVERHNAVLVRSLAFYCNTQQSDWDLYIPQVLFAYRTAINQTTRRSPFEMLFGTTPVLPLDLSDNLRVTDARSSTYVDELKTRFQSVHTTALERQKVAKQRMKTYYDKKSTSFEYEEGDRVWLSNEARKPGKSPKLDMKYLGPFTITKKLNALNYEIEPDNEGRKQVVHFNRLKPCIVSFEELDDVIQTENAAEDINNIEQQIELNENIEPEDDTQNKLEKQRPSPDNNNLAGKEHECDDIQERNMSANDDHNNVTTTTLRPRRTCKQPVRFAPRVSRVTKTGQLPKWFYLTHILCTCIISVLFPTANCLPVFTNIPDAIGPIKLCSYGSSGTLVSLTQPQDCHEMLSQPLFANLKNPTPLIVTPYFLRTNSPTFDVYACTKEVTTIVTQTSFFGHRSLLSHVTRFEPLSETSCRDAVAQITSLSTSFVKIASTAWSNGNIIQPRYRYCCSDESVTGSRIIVRKGVATMLYKTQSMVTALFPSLHCSAHATSCLLDDQVAVWTMPPAYSCEVVVGKRVPAEKHENFIVSQEGQFAVKLKPNKEMHCGYILYTTFEGMFLTFYEETKDKPPFSMLNTSTSTNFLASMEYVKQYTTELAIKLFLQTWLNVCSLQNSRYYLLTSLQNSNPTAVAKALLQRDDIVAHSAGDGILQIWECKQVTKYELRNIAGCHLGIPISYDINNHTYEGFFDPATRMITFTDFKISCNEVIAQYIKLNNSKQNLVWDGRILKLTSVAPHVIDLTLPLPAIKTIYLSEGKIDDPQYEALESLAHIQQTSQSVSSLVKLLNTQLSGVEGVDGRAVAQAAEDAGVNTTDFFSSLVHKLASSFLPSPWTIILILIFTIFILVAIYIITQRCNLNTTKITYSPPIAGENRSQLINELKTICGENLDK